MHREVHHGVVVENVRGLGIGALVIAAAENGIQAVGAEIAIYTDIPTAIACLQRIVAVGIGVRLVSQSRAIDGGIGKDLDPADVGAVSLYVAGDVISRQQGDDIGLYRRAGIDVGAAI